MSDRIHFSKIRWRNTLSTGQMWTEVILDKSPSTVITGKNGSGKSTLSDALYFALFGKAFRKINKPQLINVKNNRDMMVELTLFIDGDEYLIRRGQKPDVFKVTRNGSLMNMQGDSREFQRQFETNILRMTYDVAYQIMAVGKAQHVPFMRLDAAKRRLFVETILGLVVFGKMSQIHALNVAKHKERLYELKSEINVATEKSRSKEKYIADMEASIKRVEEESKAETQSRVAEIDDKMKAIKADMQDVIDNIPPKTDTSKIDAKIGEIKQLITKLSVKRQSLSARVDHFEHNTFCESCEQEIPEEMRTSKVEKALGDLKKVQAALDELTSTLDSASGVQSEQNDTIHTREMMLGRLRSLKVVLSNLAEQKASLLESSVDKTIGMRDQMNTQIESLEKIKVALNHLSADYESALKRTDYMNLCTSMLKDSGVKAMLIRKYLPIINHSINTNLANLGFFAKFTLSDTFEETIQARGIDTLSYNNFSEGEKLRIDLAIMLAWREVAKMHGGVGSNLLFFDEIFDSSIDSAGVDSLMILLSSLKDTSLFIITHTPEKIIDKVRSHIHFVKEDGFSKISQQTVDIDDK